MKIFFFRLFFLFVLIGFSFCQSSKKKASSPIRNAKEEIPPIFVCPPGYNLKNKECVIIIKQKPQFLCPSSFEQRDSENCVRLVTKPPSVFCPNGTKMLHGLCIAYVEEHPEFNCPNPYALKGDRCYRSVLVNPGLSCAEGYTFIHDSCVREISIKPTELCQENFLLDVTTGKCVNKLIENAYEECINGLFERNERMCMYNITTSANAECPPEAKKMGDLCVAVESLPAPELACKDTDISPNERNECVRELILDATWECEEGYELKPNGDCVITRTESKKPRASCPENTSYNEKTRNCRSMEQYLPDSFCPEGYTKTENACVKSIRTKIEKWNCPFGYTLIGQNCIKLDKTFPQYRCPDNFYYAHGKCIQKIYSNKNYQCPEGYVLRSFQCIAEEVAPPLLECPNGFELKAHQCVNTQDIDAEIICPPGTEQQGISCIRVVQKKPKEKCKLPYVINPITKFCEDREIAPVEMRCPSGYNFDSEGKKECVRYNSRAATPQCPHGMMYDQYYAICKPLCIETISQSSNSQRVISVNQPVYIPTKANIQSISSSSSSIPNANVYSANNFEHTPSATRTTISHAFSANY